MEKKKHTRLGREAATRFAVALIARAVWQVIVELLRLDTE